MKPRRTTAERMAKAAAAAALLLALAACGARLVRGEAPFAQINSMKLDEQSVTVDIGVRNVNDVVLDMDRIAFVLSVRDTELSRYDKPSRASVIANGTENLRFETPASAAGLALLEALQDGAIENLPYTIEGSITTVEDGRLPFNGSGRLYPVPGRPGQFR